MNQSDYAAESDLKSATSAEFAKKFDLAGLKTVVVDLNKLSNVVKNVKIFFERCQRFFSRSYQFLGR